MTEPDLKQQVGKFYDQVGWQSDANGLYQNAEYEDLRPVSAEYIARAHNRVNRHLSKRGRYLLDAGSGPIQYDAYLAYSAGYQKRVCLDLSFVALQNARKKLGEKGLYVVGDIAHLPFKEEAFDGIVTLHTIHHLPMPEKEPCYLGLYRCLTPGHSLVIVDGWNEHGLGPLWDFLIRVANRLRSTKRTSAAKAPQASTAQPQSIPAHPAHRENEGMAPGSLSGEKHGPAGTFVMKNNARWFKETFTGKLPFTILTWRSVSVRFLRAVVQPEWGGKAWLKVLYRLEEWFPHYFGENGQYPLIVITKPDRW